MGHEGRGASLNLPEHCVRSAEWVLKYPGRKLPIAEWRCAFRNGFCGSRSDREVRRATLKFADGTGDVADRLQVLPDRLLKCPERCERSAERQMEDAAGLVGFAFGSLRMRRRLERRVRISSETPERAPC